MKKFNLLKVITLIFEIILVGIFLIFSLIPTENIINLPVLNFIGKNFLLIMSIVLFIYFFFSFVIFLLNSDKQMKKHWTEPIIAKTIGGLIISLLAIIFSSYYLYSCSIQRINSTSDIRLYNNQVEKNEFDKKVSIEKLNGK